MFKKLLGSLILIASTALNAFAADRTLAVAFAPAGSKVEIHTNANPDTWAVAVDTNGDGYVTFQIDDSLADSDIRITAAGYQSYVTHFHFRNAVENANLPKPLNQQVNVGQDIPALLPVAPPLPIYTIQGKDFVDGNGQRTVLLGIDAFNAFRLYLSGANLDPLVAYSHTRGFNLWRVFMQGSAAQNGFLQLDPREAGYYEHVRPFVNYLNGQGIVLLAEAYVDNQDIRSGLDHWTRLANELRGSSTILSGGNEYPKNGFDPGSLPDPGMVWARGSALGDQAPFRPTAVVMQFHPRRDLPAAKMDTVASPVFIYGQGGYPQIPLLIDEPPRMGSNGSGPEYAAPRVCYEFARHYATETAGAVFHNAATMRGLVPDAVTDACAVAWQTGMRLQ
jgi:hypothetical protein